MLTVGNRRSGEALAAIAQPLTVSDGAGFGVDTNRVTVITRSGKQEELDLMSKADLAEVLLDRVEEEQLLKRVEAIGEAARSAVFTSTVGSILGAAKSAGIC